MRIEEYDSNHTIIPTLHLNAHKINISMRLKSDPTQCEKRPIRPNIACSLTLHPFQDTTFTITHFGSTHKSFYSQSNAPVEVIQHVLFFLPFLVGVKLQYLVSDVEPFLVPRVTIFMPHKTMIFIQGNGQTKQNQKLQSLGGLIGPISPAYHLTGYFHELGEQLN